MKKLKGKLYRAANYALTNYKCGNCDTGIVQIHQQFKRGGMITTTVSGCLDCQKSYGLQQAVALEICPVDYEIHWP